MILVDTTVLIYAVGASHSLRDPCRRMIEEIRDGNVRAATTLEVIQEFTHVRARARSRSDAAALARAYAEVFAPLTRPDADDLHEALALFERVPTLDAFDAVLAAAARRRRWAIASADVAFSDVSRLTHLNPASQSFVDEMLAAG